MAATNNPLKILLNDFTVDFAGWFLDTAVESAAHLSTDLTVEGVTPDHVSRVTLADGREVVLHVELQGRRTKRPMAWRMLDYMSRLAVMHKMSVCSVVIYVGHGAGANDSGVYTLDWPNGDPSFQWGYRVVRLWELPAEDLLELGQPVLTAMIGQTRPDVSARAVSEAISQIKTVTNPAQQTRLLTMLVALIETEELTTMAENLIEQDDLLLDTPFLRRIREQGREEGREEGRIQEAIVNILRTLTIRFSLSESEQQAIEAQLSGITDLSELEALSVTALQADKLETFAASLPDDTEIL